MSVERIAVATAVISATVSAGTLLLNWYRGSDGRRPVLARTLLGVMLASAAFLLVAIGLANTGGDDHEPPAPGSLTAGEYRMQLIDICKQHEEAAERIEDAEGNRPVWGLAVQIETTTTEKIRALRPPRALEADHNSVLELWRRRVSLLGHYWDRWRSQRKDPAFLRELGGALKRVDAMSRKLKRRFGALDANPECGDLF